MPMGNLTEMADALDAMPHGGVSWQECHQPGDHARFVTPPLQPLQNLANVAIISA